MRMSLLCVTSCSRSTSCRMSPQFASRSVSSSPYGRTHVWKRRPPVLPTPIVPQFPQRVTRADGSTFTHITTSPRARIKLTRDTTNNPVWNASALASDVTDEDEATGRMGRFSRRFGDANVDAMEFDFEVQESQGSGQPARKGK